ncbi:NAD(P)H-dependent oxidoreductase [Proteobacteria bacterium 005FR1]|nr:NAD(P)H-dependent oxidoreductase [Proteobacteria bacterium 005FR1]
MSNTIHLAVILGNVREGRLADRIAAWLAEQLDARSELTFTVIDPASQPTAAEFRSELDRADAIVVVTPEYNHSFPGALKTLIDSAKKEWFTKPVGFVSYGGMAGGSRAVEQLRQVFAELHAPTMRDIVSFINAGEQFASGKLLDSVRAEAALERMLAQLQWWAIATRRARERESYPAAG